MKFINLRNTLGATCAAVVLLVAGCCGGGGGGGGGGAAATPTTSKSVASILLTASPLKIKSVGSDSTILTATVLDADHAAVSKAEISFKADSGALSAGTVTTGTDGKATVTFAAGSADPVSRTATVTAVVGAVSQQIPIIITGATISLATSSSNLVVGGTTSTLTVTLKDASGGTLPNAAVNLSSAGTGSVTLSPATGKTDNKGQFISAVSGIAPGTVQVTVSAVGEKATTTDLAVTGVTAAFAILSHPTKQAAAILGVPVTVTVQAPSVSSVTFVSTLGAWDGGTSNAVTKPVSGGVASANLSSSSSGLATVQVYDSAKPSTADTMAVAFTASLASANRITIQATPTAVPKSTGGISGIATLIATVTDANGNPVGNAPVAFEIIKNTGGGESVSPAVAMTANTTGTGQVLGQANATFTAGSLPSTTGGVIVRASVVGTSINTGTSPSGSNALLTIGGAAGSVSIGRATIIQETPKDGAVYTLPMSVVVADSNGNAVAGAMVTLSSFPIAFNANAGACNPSLGFGDYYNEDTNENQTLDPGEDGVRTPFPLGVAYDLTIDRNADGVVNALDDLRPVPEKDGRLTPPNSASGTLPPTVSTDASGVATFNLTYNKSEAFWIFARIRASVVVLGTETVGQTIFRLPALETDVFPCRLPNSSYQY